MRTYFKFWLGVGCVTIWLAGCCNTEGGAPNLTNTTETAESSDFKTRTSAEPQPPSKRPVSARPERQISNLVLPISLSVSDLEKTINAQMPESLVSIRGRKISHGLKMDLDAKRRGQAHVTTSGGTLHMTVPVDLTGYVRWKGLGLGDGPKKFKFTAGLTLLVTTQAKLQSNWTLDTTTTLRYRWDRKGRLRVGPFQIDISSEADAHIRKQLPKIANRIDSELERHVQPKKMAEILWKRLHRPVKLEDAPPMWLRVDPVALSTAPPKTEGNALVVPVALKATIDVVMGKRPRKAKLKPLPSLGNTINATAISVRMPITISYAEAEKLASPKIVGRTFKVAKGIDVKILGLELSGNGDHVVAKLDYSARLPGQETSNGVVYMTGKPHFESKTRALTIQDFDYDLKTRDALLNAQDWMMHDLFVEQIQKQLVFPLDARLNEAKRKVQESLRTLPTQGVVAFDGELTTLDIDHVFVGTDGLEVGTHLTGAVTARVIALTK